MQRDLRLYWRTRAGGEDDGEARGSRATEKKEAF